jgi:4-hydroxy-tetrahydrodipicolinate reductase
VAGRSPNRGYGGAVTLSVGVIGAAGRMGATVCRAVSDADGMDLVAEVDLDTPGGLDALIDAGATIAVDFTVAGAAVDNARWCAAHGLHCVIGTTGIGPDEQAQLAEAFPPEGPLGCVVAPNFAIGAVLMMHFAAVAAPYFDTAEIIELHHDGKIDAPSGTAMATAAGMEAASVEWATDPTKVVVAAGARGGLSAGGGVHIHSVRMRGMVAHQEVILGTTGQTLTIRHDSMDRESFMPGVLAAVRAVTSRPGLTVGLERVLGL